MESRLWNYNPNNIFDSPFCSPLKSTDRLATLAPAWQISRHSWTVGMSGCRLPDDLLSAQWQAEEQGPVNLLFSQRQTQTTWKYRRSPFICHIGATHKPTKWILFHSKWPGILWSKLCFIFYTTIEHNKPGVWDRQCYHSLLMINCDLSVTVYIKVIHSRTCICLTKVSATWYMRRSAHNVYTNTPKAKGFMTEITAV